MDQLPDRMDSSFDEEYIPHFKFVVIGGGIAGVCCSQELARLNPISCENNTHDAEVALITASEALKEAHCVSKISDNLEEIDVNELSSKIFEEENPNVRIIRDKVLSLDTNKRIIKLHGGTIISYTKLCICTGAIAKTVLNHKNIIGVRDLQSVTDLANRLKKASRIIVLGNGGISLELIHE
eukprot:gene14518-30908_t